MNENNAPGPMCEERGTREKVCIHTKKIFDSCRDKDCLEDIRFYPFPCGETTIQNAVSVGGATAHLAYVDVHVEPIAFNRGFYTVAMCYYYRVKVQVFTCATASTDVDGICIFTKRAVLYGGKSKAKVFSSDGFLPVSGGLPTAIVEAVDPIVLDTKLDTNCTDVCDSGVFNLPDTVAAMFPDGVSYAQGNKCVRLTLGQFSLVTLERDVQLLVPVCDYCLPKKECCGGGGGESPCDIFSRIDFPSRDFSADGSVEPE